MRKFILVLVCLFCFSGVFAQMQMTNQFDNKQFYEQSIIIKSENQTQNVQFNANNIKTFISNSSCNSDAKKVIYSGALLLTSVMAVTHFAQPTEDRKKQNLGFYSLVAGAVGLCIAVEITF